MRAGCCVAVSIAFAAAMLFLEPPLLPNVVTLVWVDALGYCDDWFEEKRKETDDRYGLITFCAAADWDELLCYLLLMKSLWGPRIAPSIVFWTKVIGVFW